MPSQIVERTTKWILSVVVALAGLPLTSHAGFADEGSAKISEVLASATAPLSSSELGEYASAAMYGSDVESLEILSDNDIAFWKKIEVIRSANAGDELRLVYFIFSDDVTSSFYAKELLLAAKRGVKVKLLVDYWQAYGKLDLFTAMEREVNDSKDKSAQGSLQVKFYNRPSRNIILDAAYMTLGCDGQLSSNSDRTACKDIKVKKLDKVVEEVHENKADKKLNISNMNIAQSGLFLSGLYSKDPDVMAKAALEGQGIDLAKIKASQSQSGEPALSEEDREGLKEFLKLVWDAKTEDNPIARLAAGMKLRIAFLLFGESKQLNQIYNGITGIVPFSTKGSKAYKKTKSFVVPDRSHLTDYTHHKLVMKNGSHWVMGGRNIEDSYHVSDSDLVAKYLFMDTDVKVQLKQDDIAMKQSYDKIFGFRSMAATLEEVKQHAPNDFAASLGIMKTQCMGNFLSAYKGLSTAKEKQTYLRSPEYRSEKRTPEFKLAFNTYKSETCVNLRAQYSQSEREQMALANLKSNSEEYAAYVEEKGLTAKVAANESSQSLSASDKETAQLFYLENIHFDKKHSDTSQVRRIYGLTEYLKPRTQKPKTSGIRKVINGFGAVITYVLPFLSKKERENSTRYIHDAWIRGVESVCATSRGKDKREKVIFHNAYFAPPSNILTAFANMLDGSWDCGNVDLVIITNSMDTTDLSPVNVVARHGFLPVFEYNQAVNGIQKRSRAATLTYLEYENDDQFFKRSLHSKVTILGSQDMIVGSANADYRSYLMDTNNALYIRNAPELVAQHTAQLEKLIASADEKVRSTSEFQPKLEVPEYIEQARSEILKDDLKTLKEEMVKYGVQRFIDTASGSSGSDFIQYLKSILDLTYNNSSHVVRVAESEENLNALIRQKGIRIIVNGDASSWYKLEDNEKFEDDRWVESKKPGEREIDVSDDVIDALRLREEAGKLMDEALKAI